MEKRDLTFTFAVILLSLAAAAVFFINALKRPAGSETRLLQFPREVDEWTGEDIPVDKHAYEILGTDKVLLREYSNPQKEKVQFFVVYSERKRQSFHPPEYCYLGSGEVELLDKEKFKFKIEDNKTIGVNKLIFGIGAYKQLVLYWFAAGDIMTDSYYKQQWHFVLNQLKSYLPGYSADESGGALVRVSTMIEGDDINAAIERSRRFIREVLEILPSYM